MQEQIDQLPEYGKRILPDVKKPLNISVVKEKYKGKIKGPIKVDNATTLAVDDPPMNQSINVSTSEKFRKPPESEAKASIQDLSPSSIQKFS